MNKRTSLKIFQSVVFALFLREIQVRFGTQRLGYLWAVIDPFVQIIIFSTIKILASSSSMPGIDYPVFLATGFLTYNFFKDIMMGSLNAFNANKALFNYKQVKPFDTLVSRFIVQFLILSIAILIFISFGLYFQLDIAVKDVNMVLFAIIWLGVFGFSLGLLFAVIATFYETFAKVMGYISMPLFFGSGLLYTVDSLPQFAQEIILYNPVIHFIELIHGSYFHALDTKYVDYTYMLYWTVVPLFIGLFFYIRSEEKILSS
ncbi:MAG TPA: hypothetical protein ENK66_07615 [Arcobacter sp.]|jgi:capsular polysaccharide transport system permease protein|nr:hypothetical protein [Arcobacter sp.]